MELNICFLCLKRFKREENENSDFRKFNLFCKFAKDYFGLKEFKGFKFKGFRENIEKNEEEENKNVFCEQCEIVVESVCQLYLEQLGIQLRLSWKLAEMQKLLENSKYLVSEEEEEETVLITSLGLQMGKDFRAVKELRNLLEMKCIEKGKENVQVSSKSFVEAGFTQLEYWVAIKREDDDDDDAYEEVDELEIGLPTTSTNDIDCFNEVDLDPPVKLEVKLEDEAETDQESIDVKEEFTANFEDEETRFDCNNNNEYYSTSVEKDSKGDCSLSDRTLRKRKREALKVMTEEITYKKSQKPFLKKRKSTKKKVKPVKKRKASSYSKWNCSLCNKPATTIQKHIECQKKSPLTGNPLQCSFCWKSFSAASTFENHTIAAHMTVGNDGPYPCDFDDCGASFFSLEDMNWHIKTHAENPFRCKTCGLAFSNESVLKLHQLRHIRPFKLVFSCNNPKNPKNSKPATQLVYPCPDCDLEFPHYNKLHDHHARRHGSGFLKPYKCPHCASFSRYKQAHRCLVKFTCSKKELTCYELGCLKEFKNSYALFSHRRDFHTPVACSRCGIQFNGLSFKNAHDKGENELCIDKTFICSICGKSYDSLKNLNSHVTKVHCESLYKCEECGKSFKNQQNLQNHKNAQHNPGQHKCPYCRHKTFTTAPYLRRHIAYVHPKFSETSGAKPPRHECPNCHEKFRRKLVMEGHLLKCNPAKAAGLMETCKVCGRPVKGGQQKFTMEKHLVTHMSAEEKKKFGKKFEGKLHLCETCGKGFTKKNVYTKHCLTHEKEKERTRTVLSKKLRRKTSFSDWDTKEQDRNVHLKEEGYSVKVVEVEETIDKGNSTVRKVYFEL